MRRLGGRLKEREKLATDKNIKLIAGPKGGEEEKSEKRV
jgi:hypothetical protein